MVDGGELDTAARAARSTALDDYVTVTQPSFPPQPASEPRLVDLPALSGLLSARLAGDPLFEVDGPGALLLLPRLWMQVTLRLVWAWGQHRAVCVGRDAAMTWAPCPPPREQLRRASLRDAGRVLVAVVLCAVAVVLALTVILGPLAVVFALVVLAGGDASTALLALPLGLAAAAIVAFLLALPRKRRRDRSAAMRDYKREAADGPSPDTETPAVCRGIAASNVPGGLALMTVFVLRDRPELLEVRGHVANPRNLLKAQHRGASAVLVPPTPKGAHRWKVTYTRADFIPAAPAGQ